MKKVLFTMALLLTLTVGVQAAGQKHRHTPQQELADSAVKGGVVAYSDTTSSDTTVRVSKGQVTVSTPMGTQSWDYDVDDEDVGNVIHRAFSEMRGKDLAGIILVLGVLLIIFVLAPVLIIIALFYFISRNRKEKMRLAQMAVQQGQPIPDQLLDDRQQDVDVEYQKGMRQCFVGVGLMVFLGYAAGQVGFGIGALVFCIGLGKVFASRTARKSGNRDYYNDNLNNKENI
ncbi:MAG: hypothetical protein J5954_10625 [Prevotella sp.]|nr:hypothetical protein [Prevotella sp.]